MSDPFDIERIADFCHQQWIHWMTYLVYKINGTNVDQLSLRRWKRQMITPYSELTEEEKESDREQARKFIRLMMEMEK